MDWVRAEWRARIAAEYGSAAITQHLVLWMIQVGAPPDLLDAGLAIVGDELAHARLSHEAYIAAGGSAPPALDAASLGLQRATDDLLDDILRVAVRVFCLGETVAVPLFAHLRAPCSEPVARAALDRIIRDEVRHRDFGWDLLDWLLSLRPERAPQVEAWLPAMLGELHASYGSGDPDATAGEAEHAWGVAAPRDYAVILARTIERDFTPRFAARGITCRTR
jgi:hypothetical protein